MARLVSQNTTLGQKAVEYSTPWEITATNIATFGENIIQTKVSAIRSKMSVFKRGQGESS